MAPTLDVLVLFVFQQSICSRSAQLRNFETTFFRQFLVIHFQQSFRLLRSFTTVSYWRIPKASIIRSVEILQAIHRAET